MAHCSLALNGTPLAIQTLSVTETACRGYEWQATLVGAAPIDSVSTSDSFVLHMSDDFGAARTFPALLATSLSVDRSGTATISGMDRTTWALTRDLDIDETTPGYSSTSLTTVAAAYAAILSSAGVSGTITGGTEPCYGLGTTASNAVSLLDRLLGLYGYEWRIGQGGAVVACPLDWTGAGAPVSLPTCNATRTRDYTQRKTKMTFQSAVLAPEYTEITVQNGAVSDTTTQYLVNPYHALVGGNYPDNAWLDPWTGQLVHISVPITVTYYSQPYDMGGEYRFVRVIHQNDTDNSWRVAWYSGDPGTPVAPGDGELLGSTEGLATLSATAEAPITHARLYHTVTYDVTSGSGSITVDEYPHVVGPAAKVQAYQTDPATERAAWEYMYDSGQTPENADENVVTETIWRNKAQAEALAPMQLWRNNRQSHTLQYECPLCLAPVVGTVVTCSGYPAGLVDTITHSFGGGQAITSVTAAVTGSAQW